MIHTNIPVGRLGDPPDLGGAVVYLASEASAYVNGSMLMMDGGFTIGSVAAKT
jgi:NAD(P)-dependent dehydrogenase (short-subunit alcohol dehydrogenase family)